MKITVICGGNSEERAVSLKSGNAVATALQEAGERVRLLSFTGAPLSAAVLQALRREDAVFLALHGGGGEDGTLQAQLERAGIRHYTGSSPVASHAAMQKDVAKRMVRAAGVPTADFEVWYPGNEPPSVTFPCFAKPLSGGSGIDLHMVRDRGELTAISPTRPMLLESYLTGREFTVGVLDGTVLPIVELKPRSGLNDYHSKYTKGACEEICPAALTEKEHKTLSDMALLAFSALGLRDYARLDFRADARGKLCFLEANTLPGMTQNSLFPLAAAAAGMDMSTLCRSMCRMASARKALDK